MAKGLNMSKMGRPKILLEEINVSGWELLDSLIIWSAHAEYIAEQLNISCDTLEKRIKENYGCTFTEYRDKKKEKLRINLRKKQYDVAMDGNPAMLIWMGKNELSQSDKVESQVDQQHTGVFQIVPYEEDSPIPETD